MYINARFSVTDIPNTHPELHLDLKQAPSALRKNIGILGYRGSQEFEERARKILLQKYPGRAKKREGLVSSLEYMLLCMKRECAEKHFLNVKHPPARASSFAHLYQLCLNNNGSHINH